MRTKIEIDAQLMADAMALGAYPTKRAAVEAGLRALLRTRRAYANLLALGGTIDWQDEHDAPTRDLSPIGVDKKKVAAKVPTLRTPVLTDSATRRAARAK